MANILIGIGIFVTGLFMGTVFGASYITAVILNIHAKYKEETGNDFIAYINDEADAKRIKRNED